jgi:hypothetical protein
MSENNFVYIFNGSNSRYPSAVFKSEEKADAWIKNNGFSGILTKYPVDTSVYDWAITNGTFSPKKEQHVSREFKQNFTAASQEHFHYEDGVRC